MTLGRCSLSIFCFLATPPRAESINLPTHLPAYLPSYLPIYLGRWVGSCIHTYQVEKKVGG